MVCFDRVSPTLSMCSGDDGDFSIAEKKLLRYFCGTKCKMSESLPDQMDYEHFEELNEQQY